MFERERDERFMLCVQCASRLRCVHSVDTHKRALIFQHVTMHVTTTPRQTTMTSTRRQSRRVCARRRCHDAPRPVAPSTPDTTAHSPLIVILEASRRCVHIDVRRRVTGLLESFRSCRCFALLRRGMRRPCAPRADLNAPLASAVAPMNAIACGTRRERGDDSGGSLSCRVDRRTFPRCSPLNTLTLEIRTADLVLRQIHRQLYVCSLRTCFTSCR